MIALRQVEPRVVFAVVGLGGALALRLGLMTLQGGTAGPALAFSVALLLIALLAGKVRVELSLRAIVIGLLGALILVAMPAWLRLSGAEPMLIWPAGALAWWAPAVVLVAIAEEILLRGVLFSLILDRQGTVAAVAATSVLFSLIHVPLYGWQALPLDLAVGVCLAGLRLAGRGVAAPAIAHAAADLAGWWLL